MIHHTSHVLKRCTLMPVTYMYLMVVRRYRFRMFQGEYEIEIAASGLVKKKYLSSELNSSISDRVVLNLVVNL